MLRTIFAAVVILGSGTGLLAQNGSFESPDRKLRAVIIPVGGPGYETHESRVEIRTQTGRLLWQRSFASQDHNHGEGVGHAQWTLDSRFFVFNTSNSGGHQPWHKPTYFYSIASHKLYSVDAIIGPVASDFKVDSSNALSTTHLSLNDNENKSVIVRLNNWR